MSVGDCSVPGPEGEGVCPSLPVHCRRFLIVLASFGVLGFLIYQWWF